MTGHWLRWFGNLDELGRGILDLAMIDIAKGSLGWNTGLLAKVIEIYMLALGN